MPRQERFLHPSPQRTEASHLHRLTEANHRNNVIALEIQLQLHRLMAHPDYQTLRRWPRVNIQRLRGMSFDGMYPLSEDFAALESSLRKKRGPIHELVRQVSSDIQDLIEQQENFWGSTPWAHDQAALREHQDTEAGRLMIQKLSGRISFFGSARLDSASAEYDAARWMGRVLTQHLDQDTVTGGGPGIMEGGNRGALEGAWNRLQCLHEAHETAQGINKVDIAEQIAAYRQRLHSIGVRIELPFETGWNRHLNANLSIHEFPGRKRTLIYLASGRGELVPGKHPAFFVFSGGFGTKDEMWEVACAQQCGKMAKTPILLIGPEESRMADMCISEMLEAGTISPGDANYFIYCNNEVEAIEKYLAWHKIDPPPELAAELSQRSPTVSTRSNGNGNGHGSTIVQMRTA